MSAPNTALDPSSDCGSKIASNGEFTEATVAGTELNQLHTAVGVNLEGVCSAIKRPRRRAVRIGGGLPTDSTIADFSIDLADQESGQHAEGWDSTNDFRLATEVPPHHLDR